MRIRKDVWKLGDQDSTLCWYAAAVAKMKTKPLSSPDSWYYQAAVHDFPPPNGVGVTAPLPSPGEQQTYWRQCQHYSWFFLPWHRAFLFYFEQVVRKTIVELGGPDTWSLPYWNYSDTANAQAQTFPARFRQEFFEGKENPLWVPDRDPDWVGLGIPFTGVFPKSNDITVCLNTSSFRAGPEGATPGFGGGIESRNHDIGALALSPGTLENTPHFAMHIAIGKWMGQTTSAALDPIFWLHHANIDRLWSIWLKRRPTNRGPKDFQNPDLPSWLSPLFSFRDATGAAVTIASQDMLDTTSPLLDYQYEDESDPLPLPPEPAGALRLSSWESLEKVERFPEVIGAMTPKGGLSLQSELAMTKVDLQLPSGPSANRIPEHQLHYYLSLHNVTAEKHPVTNYEVFVDLPKGSDPEKHPELFAGMIPGFGLVEASQPNDKHGGFGLNYVFEITKIVSVLRSRDFWDRKKLHVTFIPEGSDHHHQRMPIKVGSVSVHTA